MDVEDQVSKSYYSAVSKICANYPQNCFRYQRLIFLKNPKRQKLIHLYHLQFRYQWRYCAQHQQFCLLWFYTRLEPKTGNKFSNSKFGFSFDDDTMALKRKPIRAHTYLWNKCNVHMSSKVTVVPVVPVIIKLFPASLPARKTKGNHVKIECSAGTRMSL